MCPIKYSDGIKCNLRKDCQIRISAVEHPPKYSITPNCIFHVKSNQTIKQKQHSTEADPTSGHEKASLIKRSFSIIWRLSIADVSYYFSKCYLLSNTTWMTILPSSSTWSVHRARDSPTAIAASRNSQFHFMRKPQECHKSYWTFAAWQQRSPYLESRLPIIFPSVNMRYTPCPRKKVPLIILL